jgi:hypothetical protein
MNRKQIKTHLDAIVYFFQSMDAEMIETLLEDHNEYCYLQKGEFIQKLVEIFNIFKAAGNTRLLSFPDVNNKHQHKLPRAKNSIHTSVGYSFAGENSGHFLDLMFFEKNGIVKSILDNKCLNENWPENDEINRLLVNQEEEMFNYLIDE